MSSTLIRILVADDHNLIREGLKRILEFQDGIKLVGEAINGQSAIENTLVLNPDIILLDVNMPDMTGIDVLRELKKKSSTAKVVMLTVAGDRETLFEAIEAGAEGYVLKDSETVDLIQAINEVNEGETYIDKRLVSLLVDNFKMRKTTKKENKISDLTERELEVLRYISEGYTNKEAGEKLFISEKTVKNYATSVFKKLEVKDRVQATLYAIRNNIDEF